MNKYCSECGYQGLENYGTEDNPTWRCHTPGCPNEATMEEWEAWEERIDQEADAWLESMKIADAMERKLQLVGTPMGGGVTSFKAIDVDAVELPF